MPDFTPGPWVWGDGWEEIKFDPIDPDDEFSGPKYADLELKSKTGTVIMPLYIDHYATEWNGSLNELSDADRALIAAAPDLYNACAEALRAVNDDVAGDQNAAITRAMHTCYAALRKAEGK